MGKRFLLLVMSLLFAALLPAQCPVRDSLHAEVIEFGDFSKLPLQTRLSKLLALLRREESCRDPYDSTHAMLLRKIGGIYYWQGDFLHAVKYYQQSLKVISDNIQKPSINPRHKIGLYFWLTILYDSLNNQQQVLIAIDSCISLALDFKASADISFVRIMGRKIEYDYDIGDYHRCIQDAITGEKLAWEYAKTGGEALKLGTKLASFDLGWRVQSLLKMKEYAAAKELLGNKLDEYKKAGLKEYVGLIYGQLAEWQMSRGNSDSALISYNQGLHYFKITGDDFNYAQMLKEMGYRIYFNHDRNLGKAMACYQKALQFTGVANHPDSKYKMESLNILENIAKIWVLKKNYDSAARYFQLALSMIAPGTRVENLSMVPMEVLQSDRKIEYVLSLLTDQGDAYLKKYYDLKQPAALTDAMRSYKATDALLERIKTQQTEVNSKLFWREDMHRMYEHAIEAAFVSGDPSNAFYFFERSRAVILNDQITEQRWQNEQEIMEQTQLTKAIQNLKRKLEVGGSSSQDSIEWQNELLGKQQRIDDLSKLIRSKHPLYYQRYLDSAHITLEDTRKKILSNHQALLELFEGDSSVYALLITREDAHFKKISKREYDSCTQQCNNLLANPDLLNSRMADFTSTAHSLYQLIFENSNVPAGRIIISPDGSYFPFEALVTDNSRTRSPLYFLEDHAISYTYSARFLMNDFANEGSGSADDFLGMAPVVFHSGKLLPNLPGSDHSLDQIADYFNNPEKLTTSAASKKRFLEEYAKFRIIHLYTHSSDRSERGEPVIYFSDSALYLSELIPERKPLAQLVVLSACETGNGQLNRGEGVFSFNRAFAAIGIPSAVINLWEVDDKATYRLMEIFYRYLSKGIPTDIALQKAKLDFMQTGSRKDLMPYYWAAAVVAGKTDMIMEKKNWAWIYYSLITALFMLTAMSWIIWRKRKK